MKRLTLASAFLSLFLVACGDIPATFHSVLEREGLVTTVNLDHYGRSEILFFGEMGVRPPFESAITLVDLDGDTVDQLNLRGLPLALFPLEEAERASALVLTEHGREVLAYRIFMTIEGDARLDSTTAVPWFEIPSGYTGRDLRPVAPVTLADGLAAIAMGTEYQGPPRGVLFFEIDSLAPVGPFLETGAKPVSLGRGIGTEVLVGTHASENHYFAGAESDSSAYLLWARPGDSGFEAERLQGRYGEVLIHPESDSTALVLSRGGKVLGNLVRYSLERRKGVAELEVGADTLYSVLTGKVVGKARNTRAWITPHGQLTVRAPDGRHSRLNTRPRSKLLEVGDVDGDGLSDIGVTSAGHFEVRDWSGRTTARLGRGLGYARAVGGTGGLVVALDGGSGLLLEMAEDREALSEQAQRTVTVTGWLLMTLVLMTGAWFHGRRNERSRIRAEAVDFLTQAETSSRARIERLRGALESLSSNPSLSAEELASEAGFSSTRGLNSLLREEFGITARKLIEEFRLRKARNLLDRGDQTVEEVSREVGFRTPRYFNTRFKRAYGVTPGDFKSESKKSTGKKVE